MKRFNSAFSCWDLASSQNLIALYFDNGQFDYAKRILEIYSGVRLTDDHLVRIQYEAA